MKPLLAHALASGLALSAVLGALLLATLRTNPEILLNDFPPDIRAKWGPMTARTKQHRVFAAFAFLVTIVTVVASSLATLPGVGVRDLTFSSAFAYFAVMFGTFNLFDWLVLDCALVYWQPRFAVLPGTEGMAGYHDYRFHFRGFLIGIPVVATGSAVAAATVLLFSRLSR